MTRSGRFVAFSVLLLLSLGAKAKDKVRTSVSRLDANFGCELSSERLGSWVPHGMTLPRDISKKFKLWRTVRSVDEATFEACRKMTAPKHLIRESGRGNVPWYDLVVAQEDVRVVRFFSKARFPCSDDSVAGPFGSWWSFEDFQQKHIARERNAVCNEWNDLSVKHVCTLKAGTVIAVGPTQSARCRTRPVPGCPERPKAWPAEFKATIQHQVFLNLFNRPHEEISKFLGNCQISAWRGRE